MDNLFGRFLSYRAGSHNVLSSLREFNDMCTFNGNFSVWPKLIVEDIEKSEFILASNS
jgi:hypothetical protein